VFDGAFQEALGQILFSKAWGRGLGNVKHSWMCLARNGGLEIEYYTPFAKPVRRSHMFAGSRLRVGVCLAGGGTIPRFENTPVLVGDEATWP